MPMSMVGLSTILMVRAEYGNYTLAGAVSAVAISSWRSARPSSRARSTATVSYRVHGPRVDDLGPVDVRAGRRRHHARPRVDALHSGRPRGCHVGCTRRTRALALVDDPAQAGQLQTAYALESAVDESSTSWARPGHQSVGHRRRTRPMPPDRPSPIQ